MSRVPEWFAIVQDARRRELAERFRPGVRAALKKEVQKLHQAHAMLIALQFAAANQECDFNVGDALAAVVGVVESSVACFDELEARHARHPGK